MTPRIIGLVFSGFMVRLYGAGMALTVAIVASRYIHHVFAGVDTAMAGIPG